MSRRSKPIKCQLLIPDGNVGYRDFADLSPEEKDECAEKYTRRMNEVLNEYYNAHRDRYRKEILESGL